MYKYGDRGGAALCRDIDQAARRPAGSSSPESLHAVADEPVERHEDDLEAGDGARAFFGLVVGFLAAPLGVPAMAASRTAELSVVETSAGGSTPPAGRSKSAADTAMRVSRRRTRATKLQQRSTAHQASEWYNRYILRCTKNFIIIESCTTELLIYLDLTIDWSRFI